MNYRKIILPLVVVALVFTVTSCEELLRSLFGVSIEERIDAFEATLNTPERADILDHFHPDMVGFNQIKDASVIIDGPLSYENAVFNLGEPVVDDADVATCSFQHAYGEGTIEFTMALDGYDYKILRLYLTVGDGTYELKRLLSKTADG